MSRPTQQTMHAFFGDEARTLTLPAPNSDVLPGVRWGRFDEALTPAFWASRVWLASGRDTRGSHRLGCSLAEEVAACLLGGHGTPAEVGLAAFERLRDAGCLAREPSSEELEGLLSAPLLVGSRRVRYRFARQRAVFLAGSLRAIARIDALPEGDVDFRNALTDLPGVGYKTASWITRNVRDSDEVAILDIHICRACAAAGVFSANAEPARGYLQLEEQFLRFARALCVRASQLDAVMWRLMRTMGARFAEASLRRAAA